MRWVIPLLLVHNSIIAYFSLLPGAELSRYPGSGFVFLSGGFYVHLAAYMILALLWGIYGLEKWQCLLASATIGVFWETLQFLVPGRNTSLSDIAANLIGASIGCILIAFGFVELLARARRIAS